MDSNCYRELESFIAELAQRGHDELATHNSLNNFYSIANANRLRLRRVVGFQKRPCSRFYILTDPDNFENLGRDIYGYRPIRISAEEFLCGPVGTDFPPVILTNNNVCSLLQRVGYEGLSNCRLKWGDNLWIIHDYDNHHWHEMSYLCQLLADFYFPAHPLTGKLLNGFLESYKKPIPIGSLQWTSEYIREHFEAIINSERSDEPLGKHNFYPKYILRSRIVMTMNSEFDEIGLIDASSYHSRSRGERLSDWISRKVHFIAPVERDVPIRFFDALLTGGLPLIPNYLEPAVSAFAIPADMYLTYGLADLVNQRLLVEKSIKKFNQQGRVGVVSRVSYALNELHVDSSVHEILSCLHTTASIDQIVDLQQNT